VNQGEQLLIKQMLEYKLVDLDNAGQFSLISFENIESYEKFIKSDLFKQFMEC